MTIKIEGLYEVKDFEKLVAVYMDAFGNYPKLAYTFPEEGKRKIALEASIRFYCAFDNRYGKTYALDENVNEAVSLVESDKMKYNFLKHLLSGSYSKEYRALMNKLTSQEKNARIQLFAELDRLELALEIPKDHIYVDFIGVKTALQGQGRGRKLMNVICDYSKSRKLPIMLFTNTELDVKFYKSLGFEMIGETHSEKFKFINWYMLKS